MPKHRHTAIPHLELRPYGYAWRRRLPRDLIRRAASNQTLRLQICQIQVSDLVRESRNSSQTTQKSSQALHRVKPLDSPQPIEIAASDFRQAAPPKSTPCFSLKTHDYHVAADRARRLTALSDETFLYAAMMSLSMQETSRLLTELVRFEIAAADHLRATESPRSAVAAQASIERERAIQDSLRDAYLRRDFAIAEDPLRSVADKLGVSLPDLASPDARWLAHEATRVLLDVSQERERRDRGEFSEPSPYFQRALASNTAHIPAQPHHAAGSALPRDAFASLRSETQTKEDDMFFKFPNFRASTPTISQPEPSEPEHPEIRETLKERAVLGVLSEDSIRLLEKGSSITISEAFSVYLELKCNGCTDTWEKPQKPNQKTGAKWEKTSANTLRTGQKIWTDFLDDTPIGEIEKDAVDEAIAKMADIPKHHGKGGDFIPFNGYVDLIDRMRVKQENDMNAVERALKNEYSDNPAYIEDRRREKAIPTIRAETYMRHVRGPNKVAKMLMAFGVIDKNPFENCSFSNDEERRLKSVEAKIARQRWDDRFELLLQTPAFQGQADGQDDPMFWIPLLADLQGLRSEEATQLSPEDFGSEDGLSYLRIIQGSDDSVKSESGNRKLPVHPALIALGLLDLVERAKANGQTRIFPSLTRGKTKGTFTENFTKAFGNYRRKHNVYWHGLDLHALRTTFHHHLMAGSCPGYIKRKLMGHEPLDEGEKSYARDGIPLTTLLEHVAKVPFDANKVVSPVRGRKDHDTETASLLKLVKSS
ncbi:hypothetical protein [Roseivivax sp. THAF30]|uniref:hypothetical protein n=1 Tax=Roseivivax sp. THAF30 TaxID=2587852 RepID=UPI00126978B7|nr:hypothetical protein [Roseivivax sp. THAF30]QFT62067.1 hypothetical protein FIU91_03925 [Roseivivax sp. THAF30]